jgi:hypothetical protein
MLTVSMVEHLPSTHEVLSLIPSFTKKGKRYSAIQILFICRRGDINSKLL